MPIFGNDNIQTTPYQLTRTLATEQKVGYQAVLPEDGDVIMVTCYCMGANEDGKCAIYDDDGTDAPFNLQGETLTNIVPVIPSWADFHFAPPLSLPAGIYWLAFFSNGEPFIYWDEIPDKSNTALDEWDDDFADPWGAGIGALRKTSIYAVYEPVAPPEQKSYKMGKTMISLSMVLPAYRRKPMERRVA